jgi:hypothetical protein
MSCVYNALIVDAMYKSLRQVSIHTTDTGRPRELLHAWLVFSASSQSRIRDHRPTLKRHLRIPLRFVSRSSIHIRHWFIAHLCRPFIGSIMPLRPPWVVKDLSAILGFGERDPRSPRRLDTLTCQMKLPSPRPSCPSSNRKRIRSNYRAIFRYVWRPMPWPTGPMCGYLANCTSSAGTSRLTIIDR